VASDGTAPNSWQVTVAGKTLEEQLDHATPMLPTERRYTFVTGPEETAVNLAFAYRQVASPLPAGQINMKIKTFPAVIVLVEVHLVLNPVLLAARCLLG
jgi:hypothetical protein